MIESLQFGFSALSFTDVLLPSVYERGVEKQLDYTNAHCHTFKRFCVFKE